MKQQLLVHIWLFFFVFNFPFYLCEYPTKIAMYKFDCFNSWNKNPLLHKYNNIHLYTFNNDKYSSIIIIISDKINNTHAQHCCLIISKIISYYIFICKKQHILKWICAFKKICINYFPSSFFFCCCCCNKHFGNSFRKNSKTMVNISLDKY